MGETVGLLEGVGSPVGVVVGGEVGLSEVVGLRVTEHAPHVTGQDCATSLVEQFCANVVVQLLGSAAHVGDTVGDCAATLFKRTTSQHNVARFVDSFSIDNLHRKVPANQ